MRLQEVEIVNACVCEETGGVALELPMHSSMRIDMRERLKKGLEAIDLLWGEIWTMV
jgi:hypothetical protein